MNSETIMKELLLKYESLGYNLKKATNDGLVFNDKDSNELTITLKGNSIEIKSREDNIVKEICIKLPDDDEYIECEETVIEKRYAGTIVDKIIRIYDYTIFLEDTRCLTDISSIRYVIGNVEEIPETEEELASIALYKTEFSSHMRRLFSDGKRWYTDSASSNETYLNGTDISKIYDIVEGPNKIEKIYDLYNGQITEDNLYDLESIHLGLLPQAAYAYKEESGITAAEDCLVGSGSKEISEESEKLIKKFIKKNIKCPYDFDLTDRKEFLKALNYSKRAVDICKETLERMLGISYDEFEKKDEKQQQELIRKAKKKNKISARESDSITMMIGNGEHSFFTKVPRGKKVRIGSGEHSCSVEAGLSLEEAERRLNEKIVSLYSPKPQGIKAKIKSIFRKN